MLFKRKKGSNVPSTINFQSSSKEKTLHSKLTSVKGHTAPDTVSLGITGATVIAPVEPAGTSALLIPGDQGTENPAVQKENSDQRATEKQKQRTVLSAATDSIDGFVVKQLATPDNSAEKAFKQKNQDYQKQREFGLTERAVSTFHTAAANFALPSAPRSTPVTGGIVLEEISTGYVQSNVNGEMTSVVKDSRDLSLPRLNRPTTRGYDVYQRPTTTAFSSRFPGISTGTAGSQQVAAFRPESELGHAGLPPYFVRSTLEDIERLPAIHPSVWASRGEKPVEYRGFVSAPPLSTTPPCTAAARRSPTKLNAKALRRPSAVKKVETKSFECWKCALRLEHSKCESTKYIRIGGGYRHSYWFVRQLIEKAKDEEEKQLSLIRKQQQEIFSEKLAWRIGKDGTRQRRIKTIVRTKSGRKIEKYQYVSEDIYNEMMELNKAGSRASESAKRRLKQKLAMSMGLKEEDADMLDNWDAQSVGADNVAVDEEGNVLLDEFGEPIEADDIEQISRAYERRRRKKGENADVSDDESERADSGLAFSDTEAQERRRRRRGGGGFDSDGRESDEYSVSGRRRRGGGKGSGAGSDGGSQYDGKRGVKGRQRRRGSDSGGSVYGSDENIAHKGKRGKGARKGDDGGSDYSDDVGQDGKRRKGKGRKGRSRSGSLDSGVSGDTKRKGKGKGKKKDRDGDDESDYDSQHRRGKGRRKGRRGSRDGSGDGSDDSQDRPGRRRKDKAKKKGGRRDDASESGSDDGGKRKSKKKGKKGQRGHGSDDGGSDYSDSPDGRRKSKRHRNKNKGGDGDGGSQSDGSGSRVGGRSKKKDRRGRKHSDDDDYSDEDYGEGRGKSKKHRGKHRKGGHSDDDDDNYASDEGGRRGGRGKKGRGRHKGDGRYSDEDSYSDEDRGHRRHRRRKDRHRDGDDLSDRSDASYASDASRHRRRRKHRRGRGDREGDSDYSGGSSGDERGRGHRRHRHRKDGRRRRGRRGSSYSDEDGSDSGSRDGEGRKKRRRRRHGSRSRRRRRRSGDGDYSDESGSRYSDMSEYSDDSRRRRRRKKKRDKHRRRRRHSSGDYSDDYSDEEGSRRRRGRRHRRRSYSYSDESGSMDSGADAESRRGRRRRHRRHRRRSSGGSSRSEYSDDSRSRDRRHRRRRHRRRDGSDYSTDEGSSRSHSRSRRRRHRRRRHRSGSSGSESGSSRSRSGSRRRRHRRRRRHYSDSDESSDRSRRHRRKGRRHRRRHSYSTSSSDYTTSSDDTRSRRRRRHRRRHSDSETDSSGSDDYDRRRGRRKDKHRKGRRHRRYSTSTEESSAGDEKPSKRRDRHRRRKDKYYSSDSGSSGSSYDSRYRRRRDKKKRRPPRPPSSDSSSLSSEASSGKLAKMSKKERRDYERRREEKTKRKEKRERQREEYERYVAYKERKKERRKNREGRGSVSSSSDDDSYWGDGRTAVKYDRGSRRKLMDKSRKTDDRDIGYDDPNDPWTKKSHRKDRKKKDRARRGEGGSDSEPYSSSSTGDDLEPGSKKKKDKKKKKGKADGAGSSSDESDAQSIYEDIFGEDGTVQRRKVKVSKRKDKTGKTKIYDDDELDAESEYDSVGSADLDKMIARQIYDEDGEVIRLTKDGRRIKDGKISKEVFDLDKHKQKKKKREKDKNMMEKSYEEEYVEEFIDEEGNVVRVVKKRLKEKETAPGKRPATPLTGPRRVQVLFLKGGKAMQSRLEKLLAECPLNDEDPRKLVPVDGDGAVDLDEREGMIDYLTHYRLVDPANLESYGKAFLVEDDDENNIITMDQTRVALDGISSIQGINDKQINYILKVLGIDETTMVTFKMFAVVAALCERLLAVMDDQTKQWMEINDLADMERKIGLYRAMFYWNTTSDRSSNYIKATSLRIELIAGGLSRSQEDYVLEKMEPNMYREVSFIDYMAFIPLFLTAHESIIDNPLDMSRNKFNDAELVEPQRDLVPLGRPMTQTGATTMKSIPIPYEFEKRPGSSLRKRIHLRTPQPKIPTPQSGDDSFPNSRASLSPVPPKFKRFGDGRRDAGIGTRQRTSVF